MGTRRRFIVVTLGAIALGSGVVVIGETLYTTRVSVASEAVEASVTTGAIDVSRAGSISGDGRYVAFASVAGNLTAGDTNGALDVFVRDVQSGQTSRISSNDTDFPTAIGFHPAISDDGRYIAYEGWATPGQNVRREIFLHDRETHHTVRVSVASDGSVPAGSNAGSFDPAITSGGLYIVFASDLALVADDTNGTYDVYLHDRQTHQTTRVSVADNDSQGDGDSLHPAISADGRYVTYHSAATNLVSGDTNAATDVFVYDRQSRRTTRVSVASNGSQTDAQSLNGTISADGRYVAFDSVANNLAPRQTGSFVADVFVHDRRTGETTCVSVASDGTRTDGPSQFGWISADGLSVVFQSFATNLVPGDTNANIDTFVHDRPTGRTHRVSVASDGSQATGGRLNPTIVYPRVNASGRYVVFDSEATNLVPHDTNALRDVFVHDLRAGQTTRVSVGFGGGEAWGRAPSVSGSARYVAFESDAASLVAGNPNQFQGIFVHDRDTARTTLMSPAAGGGNNANGPSQNALISSNGRYVAFESRAANLVSGDTNGRQDIFVFDRTLSTMTRVSVRSDGGQATNGDSESPAISVDGRFVAFDSSAANLVPNDTNAAADVFVRDRVAGRTTRVSVLNGGGQGESLRDSRSPAISATGRYVAFESRAGDLSANVHTTTQQVYLHDRRTIQTICISIANDGTAGNVFSDAPSISADGRYTAFRSHASNLVPNDANGVPDVFVYDRVTSRTMRVSMSWLNAEGDGHSGHPKISADGRYVAFYSEATNLVAGDTNAVADVFVRDLVGRRTFRVSLTNEGSQATDASSFPAISANGRYVAFGSYASNLVTGDRNNLSDVFVRDRSGSLPP